MTVTVIPTISETLKARQISDNKEVKIVTEIDINEKAVALFNSNSKQEHQLTLVIPN